MYAFHFIFLKFHVFGLIIVSKVKGNPVPQASASAQAVLAHYPPKGNTLNDGAEYMPVASCFRAYSVLLHLF